MGGVPDIVDDEQDVAVAQQFGELGSGGVQACKPRSFAQQVEDQVLDAADEAAGSFAERDPQDAVVEGMSSKAFWIAS